MSARALAVALAAALVTASCASEQTVPATEVVVTVASDLTVGTQLTEIHASVQSEDGARSVAEPVSLPLTAGASGERPHAMPLSFGVGRPQGGADRFRLTVAGYGPLGPDGATRKVVEHKALVGFQERSTLGVLVRLQKPCLQVLCEGQPDQTCSVVTEGSAAQGTCAPIARAPATLVDPERVGDVVPATPEAPAAAPVASPIDPERREDAGTAASDGGLPSPFDDRARTLVAGAHHVCVVRADATVVCWGSNQYGQLGVGATPDKTATPTPVAGLSDVAELAAGGFHTCARRHDGAVLCWGTNRFNQLGGGTGELRSPVPVAVTGLADAVEIAAGEAHTCARRRDATVTCWGHNSYGQLGDGTSNESKIPVSAPSLTGVVRLGRTFEARESCAYRPRRELVCIRDNVFGGVAARPIDGLGQSDGYAGGMLHACLLNHWGDVLCSGGTGTGPVDAGTPRIGPYTTVPGIAGVTLLAAGSDHTCGIRRDRAVVCWGGNARGQLGNGATAPISAPVGVHGLHDAVDVAAGEFFTCARRAEGSLACWGASEHGVLGATSQSGTPVVVPGA